MTLTSLSIAVDSSKKMLVNPDALALREAESVHVFAFSSLGDLLVVESAGEFDLQTFETATRLAQAKCTSKHTQYQDKSDMILDSREDTKEDILRSLIRQKFEKEERWKPAAVIT